MSSIKGDFPLILLPPFLVKVNTTFNNTFDEEKISPKKVKAWDCKQKRPRELTYPSASLT